MKRYWGYLFLAILLSPGTASAEAIFPISKPYGASAPYAEGVHAGIDYGVGTGAPVISISNGRVVFMDDTGPDGAAVVVLHGKHFRATYAHLSKVFVEKGQWLKRGQLIGLSGVSYNYGRAAYHHLHFGISKTGPGDTHRYTLSYDPQKFWLGGEPQCFDPKKDYSAYSQRDITLPLACGEYAEALLAESKGRETGPPAPR